MILYFVKFNTIITQYLSKQVLVLNFERIIWQKLSVAKHFVKSMINIFTLISKYIYITINLYITISNYWGLNQCSSCCRQSSDLNFWPRGARSNSAPSVFSSPVVPSLDVLSHSSSLPSSPSPFGLFVGSHQTLTGVEDAVCLLGVSRLSEECSVSVRGWRWIGELPVPRELRPRETQTDVQAVAAAGIVSFLVLTGVRSTCVHCAPHTQVSHCLISYGSGSQAGGLPKSLVGCKTLAVKKTKKKLTVIHLIA